MKKIAILRFWYEGNSFSPAPAMLADFQRREWLAGVEAATFYAGKGVETGAAVDFLQAHDDIEGHFLRCAAAYPAGEVEAGLFPGFIDEVVDRLRGQQGRTAQNGGMSGRGARRQRDRLLQSRARIRDD